jgi:hypothetical protein
MAKSRTSLLTWQFSDCQPTSSFTRKEEARNLGQGSISWSAVVRFDNQLDNSSGVYCPRQYTPSSNKSRRLSEVVKADNTMSQELPRGHY